MKLTLGFSPCPNDTFIFDALVNGHLNTGDLEFEVVLEDVETLNKMAKEGKLDITKLSFHAYAYVSDQYQILQAGAALGKGCGPLLISADPIPLSKVDYCVVGIPGRLTTANLLFSLAFPDAITKKELVFSAIEQELLDDRIDVGVIIHENRFTYESKGLHKLLDLGTFWEEKYGVAVPLGGIMIRRSLGDAVQHRVNDLIRQSVSYAFSHPEVSAPYVAQHAQEMDPAVMQQHISLYVNEHSLDLGEDGRNAIEHMYRETHAIGLTPAVLQPIFAGR
ncbi:MAG TPA: 1,4-dihydroxy-6-naphthoate synthase [Chitinophagales bacterium]|nr:1,4-dihydroxy-6-naphthoate synthase [Chitinophagales bacterium]HAE13971.1 1,4-dihydroxy-6-naphthoate synthase [Bacteroidota bacterium]HPE98207.1 1,4-dihydroxy-6-naphthoate synthase [Chitinophagales bacterium]HQU40825.1 1,4-dihydroxy-6-naphthoate synthase [Chitinophagales bacterium]HRX24349.1 1,4-dihydroxy-6-naphthoate synthase [Chitinophagales bacterium]